MPFQRSTNVRRAGALGYTNSRPQSNSCSSDTRCPRVCSWAAPDWVRTHDDRPARAAPSFDQRLVPGLGRQPRTDRKAACRRRARYTATDVVPRCRRSVGYGTRAMAQVPPLYSPDEGAACVATAEIARRPRSNTSASDTSRRGPYRLRPVRAGSDSEPTTTSVPRRSPARFPTTAARHEASTARHAVRCAARHYEYRSTSVNEYRRRGFVGADRGATRVPHTRCRRSRRTVGGGRPGNQRG